MEGKNFRTGEAISFGWEVMKRNFAFFFGLILIIAIINIAAEFIPSLFAKIPPLSFLLAVAAWIIVAEVSLGSLKIFLRFADGEGAQIKELFSCFPLLINYIIAAILYNLIVLVGFCLLIVPGVIWSLQFFYFAYFIIDKRVGPIEALKLSSQATDGLKWQLAGFIALIFLINLAGILALGIGLFATIPATAVAIAHGYRQLVPREDAPPVIIEEVPI